MQPSGEFSEKAASAPRPLSPFYGIVQIRTSPFQNRGSATDPASKHPLLPLSLVGVLNLTLLPNAQKLKAALTIVDLSLLINLFNTLKVPLAIIISIACKHNKMSILTHTHPFNGFFSGTTRVSRYQKGKPIWILLKQETLSGSSISWAICKSASRSRQITMPAPHHSVFYRLDALPAAQPTASKQ